MSASVFLQLATELALKAGLTRHLGLKAILDPSKHAKHSDADIAARFAENGGVHTSKFETLKNDARASGLFGLREDDWALVEHFQHLRNKLVHLGYNFHRNDLVDLQYELTHVLVHVVVRLLADETQRPGELHEKLIGETKYRALVRWEPYQHAIRSQAELVDPLPCPSCEAPLFCKDRLFCFCCGLEHDDTCVGLAPCEHCAQARCVLYDKLNPSPSGTMAGRCLHCGVHQDVAP